MQIMGSRMTNFPELIMQEDLIAEQSEKAALERILEKEKDLMESALQIEIGRASSLQVEVLAARQQRVRLINLSCTLHIPWIPDWRATALSHTPEHRLRELPSSCPQ